MRFARRSLIAVASVVLSAAVLPAVAAAAGPPTIGNAWSYGVTQTDATLEAEINPQDPAAGLYYQFQVVPDPSEFQPELLCPPEQDWRPLDGCGGTSSATALPLGFIPGATESRAAKVDLNDAGMTLQPDTTYHYRVLAARKVATEDTIQWEGPAVVGPEETFTTLATGPAPRVQSESVSNVTSTDATLEAQINPEGRETTYEFDLEAPSCLARGRGACEAAGGVPIYRGTIPSGTTTTTVSVDVDGAWYGHNLLPNTLYGYRVVAHSASGSAVGPEETFKTSSGLPPAIDSVSVSHLTPTDATLEATIDTEGLPTAYRFQLTSSPCSTHGAGCELIVAIPLPSGSLLGSFSEQTVSVELNSVGVKLGEGEYDYSVSATNEAGSAFARGGLFEAPPGVVDPPGSSMALGPGQGPYPAPPNPPTSSVAVTPTATNGTPPAQSEAASETGSSRPGHGRGHGHKAKHRRRRRRPRASSRHGIGVARLKH